MRQSHGVKRDTSMRMSVTSAEWARVGVGEEEGKRSGGVWAWGWVEESTQRLSETGERGGGSQDSAA